MNDKIKKIGVLTSGGDAPGMNAAIRAVVRAASNEDIKVIGIKKGYEGLLAGEFKELSAEFVSDIMQRGGTILHTARCDEMRTEEGQKKAAQICNALGLDALIVIGGDGSLQAGLALSRQGINVIGIPGTIDLDLNCSEYTIGFDTAVNTAMEAINKIRDTSFSHERCSIVEVMGRNSGSIALWTALAGGAEEVIIPENSSIDENAVIEQLLKNRSKGKRHNLVIVAEGIGGSQELAHKIQEITGIQTRSTILGYLQRGGSPTAVDRYHACLMGFKAVELLLNGSRSRIVAYRGGRHEDIDLEEALNCKKEYNDTLYNIIKTLAI